MLVGKSDVAIQELERRVKDVEEFKKYCDSLVPEEFKHISAIRNNQRYICCLILRTSKCIPWNIKLSCINRVMQDIQIVCYTDMLIEVDILLGMIDKERVNKMWRDEEFK